MVKSEIIRILKKKHKNLNHSQISDLVDAIFNEISKSLIMNKVKYRVIPIGISATTPAIKLFLNLVKIDFLIVFSDIIIYE